MPRLTFHCRLTFRRRLTLSKRLTLPGGVSVADAELKAGACAATGTQCRSRRLRDFNSAVEQVFTGGEDLEVLAEIVRGVRIEAEVAVKQAGVRVVVELMATDAALQAKRAQ